MFISVFYFKSALRKIQLILLILSFNFSLASRKLLNPDHFILSQFLKNKTIFLDRIFKIHRMNTLVVNISDDLD
jgi:hypothetical protein